MRQDTRPTCPRSLGKGTTALRKEYPHLTIPGEMFDAKPELVAFFLPAAASNSTAWILHRNP